MAIQKMIDVLIISSGKSCHDNPRARLFSYERDRENKQDRKEYWDTYRELVEKNKQETLFYYVWTSHKSENHSYPLEEIVAKFFIPEHLLKLSYTHIYFYV